MEDLLTAMLADICNKPPAVRSHPLLRSKLTGNLDNPPKNLRLVVSHFSQISEVLIRYNQHMYWRLC